MRPPDAESRARRNPTAAPRGDTNFRTKLLVSVRDLAEARAAVAGGADIVDLKEPARGALGAVDWSTLAAVLESLADDVPVSAALGELLEARIGTLRPVMDRTALAASALRADGRRILERLRFAKFGLAGCARRPKAWTRRWNEARGALPPSVVLVPVAYADAEHSAAPSPAAVIAWAADLGLGTVLIDTMQKDGRDLEDFLSFEALQELLAAARRGGLRLGLAGSLSGRALDRALRLAPDFVGVRGAACPDGRLGAVQEGLVRELAERVSAVGAGNGRAAGV